jgi:hypothetical protein
VTKGRFIAMAIELSANEIVLLKKVLDSYLSELRLEIVETKHDKASLHEEEEVVKGLMQKVSK